MGSLFTSSVSPINQQQLTITSSSGLVATTNAGSTTAGVINASTLRPLAPHAGVIAAAAAAASSSSSVNCVSVFSSSSSSSSVSPGTYSPQLLNSPTTLNQPPLQLSSSTSPSALLSQQPSASAVAAAAALTTSPLPLHGSPTSNIVGSEGVVVALRVPGGGSSSSGGVGGFKVSPPLIPSSMNFQKQENQSLLTKGSSAFRQPWRK
jgi:hypothetical protein